MTAQTIPELLLERIASTPDGEAFKYPQDGAWKSLTWREVGERVRAISLGLRALGLQDEQRCAIVASTRIDWILADFGIMCAAGATTTIYPSDTAVECAYILNDSETKFVFAEDDEQIAKLVQKRGELGGVKNVITFDGKAGYGGWVISMAELVELGRRRAAESPSELEKIARSLTKDSLATIIYTSGTTGLPKGVELTHACWVFEGVSVANLGIINADDCQYLWLPLAHAFGKVLEIVQLAVGVPTAVDGRIEKLVENLAVIRPTFVCGVPRIFEKVHNKIVGNATESGGLKAKIFHWAVGVGRNVSRLAQQKKSPGPWLALQHAIAHRLVFSKVHERFGGRLRFFISGSAALSKEVSSFFHAVGILVLEGYGLTETSAASFGNRPDAFRFGTVGLPIGDTQVKISPEDGEILLKGGGVMRGYHHLPEATADILGPDGWLRTGDIGEVDADGFLKITDRKKDLIKTSGGKYVAPQYLEGKLKAICPYVSQVVIHGDDRKFVTALVTLDEESVRQWARGHGLTPGTYAQLAAEPKVKELLQTYVTQLNKELPSYATVKYFAILPAELTVDAGELTPSLKVKRKAVEKKYISLLEQFYRENAAA